MPEEIQLDNKPFADELANFMTDENASPFDQSEPEPEKEPTKEPAAEPEPANDDKQEEPDEETVDDIEADDDGFPKEEPEEEVKDKSDEKPDDDKETKPESVGIKNLRTQYNKVKDENKQLQEEIRKLKESPKVDDTILKDYETTKAKLAALDFRESDTYKQLDEQITLAFQRGQKAAKEFTVEQEDGTQRSVTDQEWESFIQASDGKAAQMGKQLFGDAAAIMYGKRQKVLDAYETAALEQKKHQANWKEYKTKEELEARKSIEELTNSTKSAIETFQKQYPSYYAIEPDEKTKKALESGELMAQQLLDGDPSMSQERRSKVYASAYLRVKNFAALAVKLTEAEKTLKAREAELEKLRAGSPKGGTTSKPKKGERSSIEDDIFSIAEERRV